MTNDNIKLNTKGERQITIIDVAKRAGVSKATVGRVIGNYGNVSEKSRMRVYEAINELNYTPNAIAQGLRTRNSKTIGVVVGSIQNNFCNQLLYAVERSALKKGYDVLFCNTNENPQREIEHLRNLKVRRVDGVILITAFTKLEDIAEKYRYLYYNVPIVLADRNISNIKLNLVSSSNFKSAYNITRRYIEKGHTRIGIIFYGCVSTIQERVDGYKQALQDAAIDIVDKRICSIPTLDELTITRLSDFIRRNDDMTAIVVLNNSVLTKLLTVLKQLEKSIPGDVSVVSWDDDEVNELLGIDTVVQQVEKIGQIAAEKLFRLIEEQGTSYVEHITLDTFLVERTSTK